MKNKFERILEGLAQYLVYDNDETTQYKTQKIIYDNIISKNQNTQIGKSKEQIEEESKAKRKFLQMKKIERENYWMLALDEVFYKQAKLLENFEDNYTEQIIPTIDAKYITTYESFSFETFRKYFTWRTKIRKQIAEGNYYYHIYINELLNQIGCKDINEAMEKLITFWNLYRKIEPRLDIEMNKIMKEFYIVNCDKLHITYEQMNEKLPIKIKSDAKEIKEVKRGIFKNKLNFLNSISTYKIAQSKFLETKYGYILDECTERILLKLQEVFNQYDIDVADLLVYKNETEYYWRPLSYYEVYRRNNHNVEIIIEGIEKYVCKYETWSKIAYAKETRYSDIIKYILKTMESYIRQYLGYRALKIPKLNIISEGRIKLLYSSIEGAKIINAIQNIDMNDIIKKEVINYMKNNNIPQNALVKKKQNKYVDEYDKEEKIEIVFNKEEFAKIRQNAEKTQNSLILDDEEENIQKIKEEQDVESEQKIREKQEIESKQKTKREYKTEETPEVKNNNMSDNIYKQFIISLTEPENKVISTILSKENVKNQIKQIAQSQNQMLEVMISNINDKALEYIGDTIIESDMQSIYEDYEKEIKENL